MTLMPTFAASHIDQNKSPTRTSCLSSILFKPGTTMRDERLHGVNPKIHGNNDSWICPYPLPERTVSSSLSSWRRFCNLNTLSRCLSSFLCRFQRKGLHNTPGQEETCTAQLYKGCGGYDLTIRTWIPAYCIGVIYLVGKGWGAKKNVHSPGHFEHQPMPNQHNQHSIDWSFANISVSMDTTRVPNLGDVHPVLLGMP